MQAVIERITPEKYVLFYQNGIDLSSKELQFCISIQPEGEQQRHAIKKILQNLENDSETSIVFPLKNQTHEKELLS